MAPAGFENEKQNAINAAWLERFVELSEILKDYVSGISKQFHAIVSHMNSNTSNTIALKTSNGSGIAQLQANVNNTIQQLEKYKLILYNACKKGVVNYSEPKGRGSANPPAPAPAPSPAKPKAKAPAPAMGIWDLIRMQPGWRDLLSCQRSLTLV
eukprot:jgi/Chrzof1/1321/Cz10g02280.t1